MNGNTHERGSKVAAEIRRQVRDKTSRHLARVMPSFRVVSDIPDHLQELLERLDGMESNSRRD
ncbi:MULTISPECIES: hypothetical protein [unclassified Mesorhizobium]|uniref:hypothetical protein n=1 Tax=unclassified Mesorhizobium TaxID=325217 RepID=UPI0006F93079|nr:MULTISPECIES: hypothetical protein [unclassified Mesorhizobium]MDR7034418.1 hypothetical protein [Mesorhizobium sp. BE184]